MTIRTLTATSLFAVSLGLMIPGASAVGQDEPPFWPRVEFHRALEPAGSKVLHCAGQSPPAFAAYSASLRPNRPAVYMNYLSLGWNDFEGWRSTVAADLAHYPSDIALQVGVDMLGVPPAGQTAAPLPIDTKIASSTLLDGRIATLIETLKSFHRPVFIRLGYEFNGQWNGYTPAAFKAAWRKIAAAIKAANMTDVALVWCFSPDAANLNFMSFYPGDDVVDWWALDIFKVADFTMPSVAAFLKSATQHRFPVMIGESTPVQVGAQSSESWAQWYAPYFALIRQEPVVKAFCYINWNWAEHSRWATWGDARIELNPTLLQHWKAEVDQPWVKSEGQ